MGAPPTDSHTLARWLFNESGPGTIINYGTTGSTNDLTFVDTLPLAGDTTNFAFGTPALFGDTGLSKFGDQVSQGRDIASGASNLEPTSFAVHGWLLPHNFQGSLGTVVHKEYLSSNTWATPFVSVSIVVISSGDGTWNVAVASGGNRFLMDVGTGGHEQHLRLRKFQWNHIALTYDGTTLRTYINGMQGPTLSVGAPIDWGTHGPWVVTGTRATGSSPESIDGTVYDFRVEDDPRDLAYFRSYYLAAGEALPTSPIMVSATAIDATTIDLVFDVPMTTDDGEFTRPSNYQVRGDNDLVVTAATVVNSTKVRLTVSEMLDGATYEAIASNLIDADDGPIVAGVGSNRLTFTGIGDSPSIVLLSPLDGATGVERSATISIQFEDAASGINRDTIHVTVEDEEAVVNGVIQPAFVGPGSYVEEQEDGSFIVNIDPPTNFIFGQVVNIVATVSDNVGNSNG